MVADVKAKVEVKAEEETGKKIGIYVLYNAWYLPGVSHFQLHAMPLSYSTFLSVFYTIYGQAVN